MAALVVGLSIATHLFGERIGVNRGMGWDGEVYVNWASDFVNQLFDVGTTTYQAQRVLPSAVIHYVMRLAGVNMTVPNILLAFHVFNTVLLVFAAIVWAHLGHAMKWRGASIWVGFVALFLCFGNGRHALYYPALTDTAAFALGMATTWAYLVGRPVVLWLCAAVGMFTWPGLPPIALAMLLLRRLDQPLPDLEPRLRPRLRRACVVLAVGATAMFVVLGIHYLGNPVDELGIAKFATWVRRDLLPITIPSLAAMLVMGWYIVIHQPPLWNLRAYVRTLSWRHFAIVIAASIPLFILRGVWLYMVGTRGHGPTGAQFVCLQTLEALRGPLWGPVHHAVYFGPLFLVAMLHWRAVCRVAAEWGHAAVITLTLLGVFIAASESRQWIHLWPLLVALTIAATDARWTPRRMILFVAIALAWSKVWLKIGYDTPGVWQQFPTQRYFMHLGPWASDTAYLWHGVAVCVTAIALYILLREPRRHARPAVSSLVE